MNLFAFTVKNDFKQAFATRNFIFDQVLHYNAEKLTIMQRFISTRVFSSKLQKKTSALRRSHHDKIFTYITLKTAK